MSSVGKPTNPFADISTYTFESVGVNSNGEIIVRQSGVAACLAEILGAEIRLDLVSIPAGTFMMGDDRHHPDERPIHEVTVQPFYMGKYPITVAQYRAVMGENVRSSVGMNQPIEQVSWDDAIDFCIKLSQQTGRQYSLPSESQWEYACRAHSQTIFHVGDTITPDLANYNGDYPYNGAPPGQNRGQAIPVGSFPPNAFGLCDMHGNVWEWCLDEYQPSYQGAPIDGSAVISSTSGDLKRVMRGGAWDYVARGCRSAVRGSLAGSIRIAGCGFRVISVG
jgi:formylglycine-generating enzyme required for sulfatase activity